jgi:hypothetical protein
VDTGALLYLSLKRGILELKCVPFQCLEGNYVVCFTQTLLTSRSFGLRTSQYGNGSFAISPRKAYKELNFTVLLQAMVGKSL